MKGNFIERFYDIDHNVVLVYEYKGYKYEVIDFGWKGGTPLAWQHKNEQARIDELIERANRSHNPNFTHESYEKGFEIFWEYINS